MAEGDVGAEGEVGAEGDVVADDAAPRSLVGLVDDPLSQAVNVANMPSAASAGTDLFWFRFMTLFLLLIEMERTYEGDLR